MKSAWLILAERLDEIKCARAELEDESVFEYDAFDQARLTERTRR